MRTVSERLDLLDTIFMDAANRGLMLETADDEVLDGRLLPLDGRELVNFGSCSYLGLEMDQRVKDAVCDAVQRYGTQFSTSRSYLSAPQYLELEGLLEQLFGGPVMVAPSTTLGHMSTVPVLVAPEDVVILDQQVHHSVHLAVNQARAQGTAVEVVRHNRLDLLEERIEELRGRHPKIWYMADGVYSMFADLAPVAELVELRDRHEQLHLYIDDSHGMSWWGEHGRGYVLDALPDRERVVVAASLNKAFAAAGGAFVFPDAETARRVRVCGGPMIFSGPIQPPMLGAAVASARIHLSPEITVLQERLQERVRLANTLMDEHELPLVGRSHAPIRYVGAGLPHIAHTVAERLLDEGIYVNTAPFPAVPMKRCGIRTPITVHNTPDDIRRLVTALARHLPEVLAQEGSSLDHVREEFGLQTAPRPIVPTASPAAASALTIERARSIDELDPDEWNRLLGDRGSFDARGLRFLERAFGGEGLRPEDEWDFYYYVVRDGDGVPVLATFFTAALWKDDMLSPAAVSRRVEERRADDPYYLTSRTFAMGSLLTEGEHLYVDRGADWRGALALLLEAVSADQRDSDATALVVRDCDADDRELEEALLEGGLVRYPMLDSLVLDLGDGARDDEGWLAALSRRARKHQREEVLAWQEAYEVEVLRAGGRTPDDHELDHLYGLYQQVQERGLELNTFDLPPRLLRAMVEDPCWELFVLYLRPEAGGPEHGRPVAFGAVHIGDGVVSPLVVGLDYDYVVSHRCYRQALLQALRTGQRHGARRVHLGMGAPLEKQRFGAVAHERVAFVQVADHYAMEVLTSLEADLGAAPAAR